jgi:Kef-type K+ transport system membrane component KefB
VADEVSFNGLLLVMVVAVAIPLVLGLVPRVPIPGSVVEILAGILIGPAVLAWATPDRAVDVLAKLGVAFLLFLAGLELDFERLRGRALRLGLATFGLSVVIGLALTAPLGAIDVVLDPVFVTIVLSATALGIVMPVLKDTGRLDSHFGVFVVASCSIAEFGSIVLLSMFFSGQGGPDPVLTAGKLVVLLLFVAVIAVVSARASSWPRLRNVMYRLQDTSAQIRIRIAVLLLLALLVLSESLKFDSILGAFLAGALLSALSDADAVEEDVGQFRHKLDGIGFGFFIPVFFVSTGVAFPLTQLFDDDSALIRIPVFLLLLLLARGLPALLLRHELTRREVVAAALLQATSLSFIVVAAHIGQSIGELRPINAASLLAAGMLSVLIFPAAALAVLRRGPEAGLVPDARPGAEV